MSKPLSQVQVADLLGVSPRRVRQLDNEGDPPPKNEKGQYPTREMGNWLRQRYEVDKEYDYTEERARLTHHQANKEELMEKQLKGDLLPSEQVLQEWVGMASSMRARMLVLPGRLASKAIGANSLKDIEDYTREEIYAALKELSVDITHGH